MNGQSNPPPIGAGPQPRNDVNLDRRRNWRHLWTTDLEARTATHECGLHFRILKADDLTCEWDAEATNQPEALAELVKLHGRKAADQMLVRLWREAKDVYLKRLGIALWPMRNPDHVKT